MFLSLLNSPGFFAVSREAGAFVNDPALAYQALPLVAFVFLSVVEDARDPGVGHHLHGSFSIYPNSCCPPTSDEVVWDDFYIYI
jgi:hypothetical protein